MQLLKAVNYFREKLHFTYDWLYSKYASVMIMFFLSLLIRKMLMKTLEQNLFKFNFKDIKGYKWDIKGYTWEKKGD